MAGERILIIEDNVDVAWFYMVALRHAGYQPLIAYDGPSGLAIACDQRPDLVLLDLMLPGLNGLDVCRALRRAPAIGTTPLLVITACGRAEDRTASFAAGADDFLIKPCGIDLLYRRVRNLLSAPVVRRRQLVA